MKFCRLKNTVFAVLMFGIFALIPSGVHAQTGEEQWASWWYGVFGGANINLFSGVIHNPSTANPLVASPNGFTSASGVGLALGAMLEYNAGKLLGGNLMIGYDNRAVSFDDHTMTLLGTPMGTEALSASMGYLSIEPNLRINLGSRWFHLSLGPSFSINVAKGYEYTITPDGSTAVTTSSDLAGARSLIVGGQAGIGYDIPISKAGASTQMLLTPFAQFHLSQGLLEDGADSNDFKLNTIRIGLQLKFGSSPISAPPPEVLTSTGEFAVRAPAVVTESRNLNETFPMRNYIFFDPGSTDLPPRYTRLSSGQAASFREEQLIKSSSAGTGNENTGQVRSLRQMEVYYQGINVFGDRLRRNPSASIKLVGSANGDAVAGKKMAENVKSYLVSTFGIDGSRISIEGRAMPVHKSGSGNAQGDDKKLIDAENNRVEIIGTPDELMLPVNIISVQEEPIDNDIVVTIPTRENLEQWTIEITDNTGKTEKYGPYRYTTVARIDSKALLGTKREGRYTTKLEGTTKDGQAVMFGTQEFRLVRDDGTEEQTGTRYSILFEFDDSKTVQTYETFLSQTVAPAIPDGSAVIIHGHTDVTGEPDYNQKLSQRRSEEAQRILTRELTNAGKKVTFDTYGFGEDERRSPFNNNQPEQRYYNRTVVIEVVPGR